MSVLRIMFALAVLGYFVWRARSCRLFLLGIPFLLVTNESLFVNMVRPLWMPGRVPLGWRLVAWLLVVWVWTYWSPRMRDSRRPFGGRPALPEELLLVGVFSLVALNAVLTVVAGHSFGDVVVAVGSQWGALGIGYLLLRGVLAAHSREETMAFLTALAWVTVAGAVLYVLHQGLGIRIYEQAAGYWIVSGGRRFSRSFTIAPHYHYLILVLPLCQRRLTTRWVCMLAVGIAALGVSYTRGALIQMVVVFLVLLVARRVAAGPVVGGLHRLVPAVLVTLLVGLLVWAALPLQTAAFLGRFGPSGGLLVSDYTSARAEPIAAALRAGARYDRYFGAGFVTSATSSESSVYSRSVDTAWVYVAYNLGWAGVAMVAAMLVAFTYRAARLGLRREWSECRFGLLLLGLAIPQLVEVFMSSSFLAPTTAPLGLWIYALIAVEAVRPRAEPGLGLLPSSLRHLNRSSGSGMSDGE